MDIPDCIWDEDFLCVEEFGELEPTLVAPSLSGNSLAPFPWSDRPVADEADNADMTPQCMPVIDPNFVRENFIEDCLLDGVSDVIDSGDDVLAGYLADQESSEQFGTLHVLVCGFCHCVFHVVEEFKSHQVNCEGNCRNSQYLEYDSNTAVALVLWTNSVMRRVRESLAEIADSAQISHRIQARWWRLSKRSRQVWEKAAEALRELAKVGNSIFPLGEMRTESRIGELSENKDLRWPGPQDFGEADEIEMLGHIKVEQEDNNTSQQIPTEHIVCEDAASRVAFDSSAKHECQVSGIDAEKGIFPVQAEGGTYGTTTDHRQARESSSKNTRVKRDRKGRWNALEPKPQKNTIFSCSPCQFQTDNPWKMERHKVTSKHKLYNLDMGKNDDCDSATEVSLNRKDSKNTANCFLETKACQRLKTSCGKKFTGVQSSCLKRSGSKRKSAVFASEKVQAWTILLARRKR